jgi:hypothetical protein
VIPVNAGEVRENDQESVLQYLINKQQQHHPQVDDDPVFDDAVG